VDSSDTSFIFSRDQRPVNLRDVHYWAMWFI